MTSSSMELAYEYPQSIGYIDCSIRVYQFILNTFYCAGIMLGAFSYFKLCCGCLSSNTVYGKTFAFGIENERFAVAASFIRIPIAS